MHKKNIIAKNRRKGDEIMINFNTDLADERNNIYRKANKIENNIDGIETEEKEVNDKIKISRVKITNEKGAEALGKPIGNYITIDVKKLKIADADEIQKASETVTDELRTLLDKHIDKKGEILIVGLGNAYVTPDSLRSKSCKRYRCNKAPFKICTRIYCSRDKVNYSYCTRGSRYNRN